MDIACIAAHDLRSEPRVLAHARALGDAGHRVTVVGVLTPGAESEEDRGPVLVLRVPLEPEPPDPLTVAGVRRALRISRHMQPLVDCAVQRAAPSVIHAFGLDVAAPALRAARRIGAAFVLDDPGGGRADAFASAVEARCVGLRRAVLSRVARHLRWQTIRLEERLRAEGVDIVVTASPQLADDLTERYGAPRPVVVRNCFPSLGRYDQHRLRVRLGTYPGERLIAFRGDDGPGSGAHAAIRAMRILGAGHVLVFLGRTRPSPEAEAVARECGVTSRLRFVAPAPEREILELLASADVAVLPREPLGRAAHLALPPELFECIAAGVPLAASDLPATGALVRETGAGVLYTARRPTDPGALAEAVRTLLVDDDLAATCRERARAAARSDLSWGRESQLLVEAYEKCFDLERNGSGSRPAHVS